MNLYHLTDKTLLNDTKFLAARERELLTKLLHHLKEIDKRKLYSDLGYRSMFDYCVRDLGFSEGSAHRRIQGARLLADLPQIEEKIENGLLNLSNISKAQQFFNQHDVEKTDDKVAILEQLENLSAREGDKMLFALSGEEPSEKERKKRVSESKTRLSFVLNDETLAKCEELKSLLGKNLSMEELINYMLEISIEQVEKKKFKITSSPKVLPPTSKVNRVINAATKRDVYLRDDKKCVKCGGRHRLNFDHQIPFALGGTSDKSNIRLLCFNCNQRARVRAKL